MDSSLREWGVFLERCLEQRVRVEHFGLLSRQLYAKSPISGKKLADILVRPQTSSPAHLVSVPASASAPSTSTSASPATASADPLVIVYLEHLLAHNRFDASDLLSATFKWSRDHPSKAAANSSADGPNSSSTNPETHPHCPLELEEVVFHRLAKAFKSQERPSSVGEARKTWSILAPWMAAMATANNGDTVMQAMSGGMQQVQTQSVVVREAFAMLVMALIDNPKAMSVLNTVVPKDIRKQFLQSLSLFITSLTHSSIPIANLLEEYQKAHGLVEEPMPGLNDSAAANSLDVSSIQLEAVIDLPVVNTRAGLYIFLNSLLVARPLTDENVIFNYLHMRYKGDIESCLVDLITASFDVLSNAVYRNENNSLIFSMRSFVINKLPTLLVMLSATLFPPLTVEYCITRAFGNLDPNTFPSAFDMSSGNSALSDIRQQFLSACALHRLIPADSIERLLGEPTMGAFPVSGKYQKESLLTQCATNSERIEELINELENVDGNAEGIVKAVTEVIRNLSTAKETMSLKSICNSLSRRPQVLEVMLQFTSPASILQPLCHLLDSWRYEDDQAEHQPVYDEFGSILLLVLAFTNRYELTYHDIGLTSDSFVSQLMERGHLALNADELSEEQSKHLLGWMKGLLDPDGVTDELLSSCRPQEYYLLVPTLFSQTSAACTAEVLSLDTVKGGFEILVETFLLPSLVGAIVWITTCVHESNQNDSETFIQLLFKLIRPSSISGDAQAMHGTVLDIVAKRLDKFLRTLESRSPLLKIEPLLEALKSHINFERSAWSTIPELHTWTSTPGNTFRLAIRSTFHGMVVWATNSTINLNPPNYTHRLILMAVKMLGSYKVLRALVEEVKSHTEQGSGAIAIDIATSFICAPCTDSSPVIIDWVTSPIPAPTPPRGAFSLREMLKIEYDNAADIISSDPLTAEVIVRLHRRVEAQLSISQLSDLAAQGIPTIMQGIGDMGVSVTDPAAAAGIAGMGAASGGALGGTDLGVGAADLGELGVDMQGTSLEELQRHNSGLDAITGGVDPLAGLGDGTMDLTGDGLGVLDTQEDVFAGLELDPDMDGIDF